MPDLQEGFLSKAVPDLSIIIPCYNQAIYLPDAIASVQQQTLENWECIVVNDCSNDDTAAVAMAYSRQDARIRYLCTPANLGLAGARNFGIAQATGQFILPLDADDKIAPNYGAAALSAFHAQPGAAVVYALAELFGAESGPWQLPAYQYGLLFARNPLYCSAFFRKADWQRVGGYDDSLRSGLEDWDFWLKLLNEDSCVIRLPFTGFYYRRRQQSMIDTLTADNEAYTHAKMDMLQRHAAKWLHWSANYLTADLEALQWYKDRDRKLQANYLSRWLTKMARIAAGIS
jgi:glycosyltransferase involved in cell wall biosynthesis